MTELEVLDKISQLKEENARLMKENTELIDHLKKHMPSTFPLKIREDDLYDLASMLGILLRSNLTVTFMPGQGVNVDITISEVWREGGEK